ncbi:MAG: BLUF domain-containing protein [Acidobacteria bacterium]|nr:BLUF domain-containing protein [Acidobacteriota bacterium]
MFYLVYVSVAAESVAKDELLDILSKSRTANAEAGITGMLLYKDGNFMQVLEGEEDAVRALYARIRRDPRHLGIVTVVEGQREARCFGDWSMGFQDLGAPEARAVPGYSEFLNTPLTAEEFSKNPGQCERLLWAFKRGE